MKVRIKIIMKCIPMKGGQNSKKNALLKLQLYPFDYQLTKQ